jgi:predicted transcriptional regulator
MKLLSLKVPDALDHRLAHEASCRKSTKSEVVRKALQAFLAETGSEQAGSALTLAKDLAGCITGPSDLSVNPTHLKRFGRPYTGKRSATQVFRPKGFRLKAEVPNTSV